MYRLSYVSEATDLLGPRELKVIGESSMIRNAELDITGVLVMDEGRIVQILEGEEKVVMALFEKIAADRRHKSVRQVAGGFQKARYLSCWSLASGRESAVPEGLRRDFHRLYAQLSEREGFKDILPEEVELLKVMALFRSVPAS